MRSVLLALLTAACSSPSEDPPDEELAWGPCDPPQTLPGECSTLRVPVDWDDPDGDALDLPVLRIPARSSSRLGVLVFNFGGPGLETRAILSGAYPDWVVPGSGVLADHFDWLVLEWRGAAPSMNCTDGDAAAVGALVRASPDEPRTSDEWRLVAEAARALQGSCLAEYGPALLGHLDAASAARDFEELRRRLHEPHLNMLSFSYGTVLATTYAALFPEHVRAFVLDSPLPMELDFRALALGQARALEEALDRFLAWCGEAGDECAFSAGSPDATAARWDALHQALEDSPLQGAEWSIEGGRMLFASVGALYWPGGRRQVADALVAAESGDAAPLESRYVQGLLDESTLSSLASILGVDVAPAEGFTPEALEAFLATDVQAFAPRMGALAVAGEALSADWPVQRDAPRPSGPVASPPLLVTSSLHDVGTAHEWAVQLVDELDNGSFLLTADHDGHVAGRSVGCVAEAIVAHLMAPTVPPAASSLCAPE